MRGRAQPRCPPISSPPVTPELDPERLGDHLDRLYRAAWGLCGSREDAEDLVQETYARVLRRPRMLRRDEDLVYLLRVLRNTFLNSRRTASRRPQQTPMPLDPPFAEPRGTVQPDTAAEASELFDAIAALPEDFRDVLVAVDVVGLSYAEAGRAFKLKEATVTSRLYRARERVARAVGT
jgi:RNA polymerase sigma-70 factor (ECF subfamily)